MVDIDVNNKSGSVVGRIHGPLVDMLQDKRQNKPVAHQRHEDGLAGMLVKIEEPAHVVEIDLE